MTDLNICPVDMNICVTRGDTTPWTHSITFEGNPVDITGYTYRLTVDPAKNPTDALSNLFSLVGVVVGSPNNVVQFEMSAVQADQTPKDYYFDIEQTDASSKIRTIAKGKFTFEQDISK